MDQRNDKELLEEAEELEREPDIRARRRLLQILTYTPPAIVGTLLVSKKAFAQPVSCPPGAGCQPNCSPASCGPSTCKPAG